MKIIRGDLIKFALNGKFDVIIHGCNCYCTMGAGITKTIKKIFPEVYIADCSTIKGSRSKLGTYSSVTVLKGNFPITVINAYTQYNYCGSGVKADYGAIRSVFKSIGMS